MDPKKQNNLRMWPVNPRKQEQEQPTYIYLIYPGGSIFYTQKDYDKITNESFKKQLKKFVLVD